MKVKFKDGTIIEVTDTKGKSKEEMIAEAKKVYKEFKDKQKSVKDSSYYIGFVSDKEKERIKEGCKKYDCKINVAGWEDGMADLYITGSVENLEQVVKNYTHKNFYKSCVSDSKKIKDKKSIKDAFNKDQRNAMTRYLIQEGELEEGEILEDLFGSDLENALELVYWGTQYESQGAIDVDKFKIGVLYEWCDSDIIDNITKEYVRENDYEEIYSMEEFDEIMSGYEPWDLAKTIFNSDYNPNHKYFKFRGDGNLESFDNIDDELSKYEEDALKWAINNNQNIDCDMYNLLEEYEDTIVLLTYFVINELGY